MTEKPAGAVFLDRDGTLIHEHRGFITSPEQIELIAGAASAVRRLNDAGIRVVLVTNQSAVARGLISEAQLARIHAHLVQLLAAQGARLDAIYYCPHHPEGTVAGFARRCACRKPADGLLRQAIAELAIDPRASFLIGDDLRDLEAALPSGTTPVLVRTGKGGGIESAARHRFADTLAVFDDLSGAADHVLVTARGSHFA